MHYEGASKNCRRYSYANIDLDFKVREEIVAVLRKPTHAV